MAEIIEFDILHEYSLYDIGITVDLILQNGNLKVDVVAKIDTSSNYYRTLPKCRRNFRQS